uniref:Uncharacterized protein n=1 Tax=Glossina pallidipes TaxID=7398 RepID=A0A1B0AAG7_GLOPL
MKKLVSNASGKPIVSIEDNEPFSDQHEEEINLSQPISEVEIKDILRTMDTDTPDVDGTSLKTLRRVFSILQVLFNNMLLLEHTSPALKRERAVLIQKNSTDESAKWRPLTFFSVFIGGFPVLSSHPESAQHPAWPLLSVRSPATSSTHLTSSSYQLKSNSGNQSVLDPNLDIILTSDTNDVFADSEAGSHLEEDVIDKLIDNATQPGKIQYNAEQLE